MIESSEEFLRLRTSDNPEEYRRSAHEPATEETWMEIIEKYPRMREWVAHNKTVKGKILEFLAKDKDCRVREVVATRRIAGPELLSKLARDINSGVRFEVANNPKVTKEILLTLVNDESEDIREIAIERLKNFKV